ncbi:MAG: tetratricopeptide repeat protein [Gammaproteobacteria bacterium]|nr:tetratricopeptide repeat protein [Gammaproteobacteria bacterium]
MLSATLIVAAAWGHGDRHEYLALLDEKIEANPDSVPHLLDRAATHRRLGHFEASLADLDRVVAFSPGNRQVHYLRGLTHLRGGSLPEAEASLRRYLKSEPENAAGHTALAETLTGQGRHVAAAEQYTLAIAAQPVAVPDHYLARANAYRAAGSPYLGIAIKGLDEGMSSIGPLITLQRLAIEIELDRGDHAKAIARVDEVLANAPRKETWLVRKGRILASAGQETAALEAFRSARAAVESLPVRVRSSPAMTALRQTIANYLNKDTTL